MSNASRNPGFAFAIMAALLFGASTPAAKLLLPGTSPWLAAGLLYLGSGMGLVLLATLFHLAGRPLSRDEGLKLSDTPWVAAATLFGGILGPSLLMAGLARTEAATASLLLNLEGVLTALLAWFVFKENFDRRIALGMALILAGGIVLSWSGGPASGSSLTGPMLIAGACLSWALDNNFTRKISGSNPVQLVAVKSIVAGATNVGLALATGATFPPLLQTLLTGGVGFVGYGLSLLCFVMALRFVGTARTGAFFSLAPFAGALLSIAFLGESLTLPLAAAAALMTGGVWLHLTENHGHEHEHEAMEHTHSHIHDEHHAHEHEGELESVGGAPHTHRHVHRPLRHVHSHFPDLHHRHEH